MKILIRVFLFISLLLFVGGFATCFFGEEYELSKIDPETRKTADTDWVGAEWGFLGMKIAFVGFLVLLLTGVLGIIHHIHDSKSSDMTDKIPHKCLQELLTKLEGIHDK